MSEFVDRIRQLSPQRLMLLAMELNARLEAAETAKNDPVAVVGLGLRFPGGAVDEASFWKLLSSGVDAIQEIPASRFDISEYFDPDSDKPGKISTRWGGFIEPVDQFEPQFFGITPREALTMDPQQRMVLEVAWEALENAGYAPDRLSGSRTGVFLGACNNDYHQILLEAGDQAADMYLATGNAHSVLSGRVSYILGLQGPSLTVDTACSSSLVAIYQACLSLKSGECRMALAGGVNAILSPNTFTALSRAKMLAPDGRCKAFDASADGFVRSEGCGIIVLKRLSDAQADGDRILAVIRGAAINQDGRSNGLTAPNGPSQVSVIRAALADAGLSPADVSYIETHGTGTALGDPIEVQALGEALGPGHTREQPLWIGSVKTNLGHLESAAGVAGVIKLVLALQRRQIPPSLHFQRPTPYIAWDQLPIAVSSRLTEWQPAGQRWIGGVSSFGFSGTNVHLILEAAPVADCQPASEDRPLHLLRLSARSKTALKAQAARLVQVLEDDPSLALADVCFTQNAGRASLPHRLALVASSLEDARQKLAEAAGAGEADSGGTGQVRWGAATAHQPRVCFLYTGSGSQWIGMGRQLYETQPIFRKCMQQCEELFQPYLPEPLLSAVYPGPGEPADLLDRFLYTQAAVFSISYALAELWKSWGVVPDAVLGHSLGEYAAAVTAGVLRLEDGVRLVAARGRLLESLPETGVMYAVFAPQAAVESALAGLQAQASLAAVNGPESTVISGRAEAVGEVVARMGKAGYKSRRLAISQAAHSPILDPILDEFERVAAGIPFTAPQIDMISTLLGRQVQEEDVCTPAYWRRHLREPVQFAAAIEALDGGSFIFIEIGPNPVLIDMAQRFLPESEAVWAPSLNKGKQDWAIILDSLAAAYVRGVEVDWPGFDSPYRRSRLPLPTYPFERQRHWIEPARKRQAGAAGGPVETPLAVQHPLLHRQVLSPSVTDIVFEAYIRQDRPDFLEDHRVYDTVILPSPAFLEMAWTAGERIFGPGLAGIERFSVQAPLEIPEQSGRMVQMIVKPPQNSRAAFEIYSLNEASRSWTLHASGELVKPADRVDPVPALFDPAEVQARCPEEVPSRDYYERLAGLGLDFGPRFMGIDRLWRRDGEALGRICLPEELEGDGGGYHFHPAFLDACFHILGAPIPAEELDKAYLLIGIDRFQLYRAPGRVLWSHAVTSSHSGAAVTAVCRLYDEEGRLVAEASGLLLKSAGREAMLRSLKKLPEDWLYRVAWQPAARIGGATIPTLSTGTPLPAPQALASALAEKAGRSEADPDYAAYERLTPHLDRLAAASIVRALETLGRPLVTGQSFCEDELLQQAGILPRYRRRLRRILEILAGQGVARQDAGGWTVVDAQSVLLDAPQDEALAQEFPAYAAEIRLLSRCTGALASILSGKQDPLALLFPGGSLESTEALYGGSPYARAFNSLIGEAVRQRIPDQGPVRILEIGAGTGATTAGLLPFLPADRAEYTFSDISPLFLDKAREKFRAFPYVSYQLFDVEREPMAQGLAAHSYDIVLAANVLHATADLRRSLEHARQLLRPGGLLLVLEGTRQESWVDLTFGLTEGWWRFTDAGLRAEYPLLSRSSWLELLASCGFAETASLPGPELGSISGQELFLAQVEAPQTGWNGWLVLADSPAAGPGLGEALANELRKRGDECILAYPGQSGSAPAAVPGTGSWQIDPADPAGYSRLVGQFEGPGRPPLRGVVYLWGLNPEDGCPSAHPSPACEAALYLVQSLQRAQQPAQPSIWLVTRGAQPVNGRGLEQIETPAALWGLGRTLWLEHPQMGGSLIDLDPAHSLEQDLACLLDELSAPDSEDQVAYKAGQRFVPRLERAPLPGGRPVSIQSDGSYLITGGLGGLGVRLAQFLARQGARHLVLLGRTVLPPREQWADVLPESPLFQKVQAVQAIEALGAAVTIPAGDVSDPVGMTALFEQFGAALPPLRGIIHAAADVGGCRLTEMDGRSLGAMLQPKVNGTLLLHQLSLAQPVDFFVLFSSTTALLGSHNLAHYAAANSFLDSFAHFRRSQGLPAVSINWGTWDIMRAVSQAEQQRVAQFGLNQMPAELALEMMASLMTGEAGPQVTVASVDWDTLKSAYEARRRRPFLDQVENARKPAQVESPPQGRPAGPTLVQRVQQARAEDRYALLARFIAEQVAGVIGGDARSIDEHQGLFEMGLDSLMSVELKTRLERGAEQSLPSTLTFNYPSVAELAGFLLERLSQVEQPAGEKAPRAGQAAPTAPDDLDDLSEEELAKLLSDTLTNTGGMPFEEMGI